MRAEARAVAERLGTGYVDVVRLAGGFSHDTWLLTTSDGRVVVRLGGAAPAVEAAVTRLAAPHVPVPAVLHVEPVGTPGCRAFSVIEHVDGVLLEDLLGRTGPDDRAVSALGHELGEVAGRVGRVTFDRPGFFSPVAGSPAASPVLEVALDVPWSEQLVDVARDATAGSARLAPQVAEAWVALCERHAPELRAIDDQARLVHSDLNPKNVLVRRRGAGWEVAALLDWEFAYAGCPYADVANFTRFDEHPAGFVEAFTDGFATTADELVPGWQNLGRVLDLFALSLLVAKPAASPVADRAARLVAHRVAHGLPA